MGQRLLPTAAVLALPAAAPLPQGVLLLLVLLPPCVCVPANRLSLHCGDASSSLHTTSIDGKGCSDYPCQVSMFLQQVLGVIRLYSSPSYRCSSCSA